MKKPKEVKSQKPKSGRGRPKWIPDLTEVEALAQRGLNLQQIADYFGINVDTIHERKKDFSDFSDAIRRGKAKGIAFVASKLMQKISEGAEKSIHYYLERKGGFHPPKLETTNLTPENKQETEIPEKSKIPEDQNDAIKLYVKIMGGS
jgi:hypothetical protein